MNSIEMTAIQQKVLTYLRSSNEVQNHKPSRLQISLLVFIVVLCAFLSLRNYNQFQLGAYQDDASYAVLAKSIVFSETYGLINVPGDPQPTRYPFGFPLILVPMAWLFPTLPESMKFISLLATLINILLIFWGWKYFMQDKSYWRGLGIATLYATSPLVIGHTRMVMSDPVFLTFVLISIILIEKHIISIAERPLYAGLTGAILFLTIYIRTIGVMLLATVIFRLLFLPVSLSHRLRRLCFLAIGGATLLSITVFTTPVTILDLLPVEYTLQYQQPENWDSRITVEDGLMPRLIDGLSAYISVHLREAVLPIGGGNSELELGRRFGITNLPLLTSMLIGGLILLGGMMITRGRGAQPTVLIFEILYLGLVLVWPWRHARFLYPILPFLINHLLTGISQILGFLGRIKLVSPIFRTRGLEMNLVGIFLAITLLYVYKGISDKTNSTLYHRDLKIGATWLKSNSPDDALIMAQQPQAIYLHSGRHTVDFPQGADYKYADQFMHTIQSLGVDYILIGPELMWRHDGVLEYDNFTSNEIIPMLHQLDELQVVELVYASDMDLVSVYEVKPP